MVKKQKNRQEPKKSGSKARSWIVMTLSCLALAHILLRNPPDMDLIIGTTSAQDEAVSAATETATAAPTVAQPASTELLLYQDHSCRGNASDVIEVKGAKPYEFKPKQFPQSLQVKGQGVIDFFDGPDSYSSFTELERCVNIFDLQWQKDKATFTIYTSANESMTLTARKQIPEHLQRQFATVTDLSKPHMRIVYSATSSEYFAFQLQANALGFLESKQSNASWTRLISSRQPDDLAEKFPTFTGSRSIFSRRYGPINKPDVIDKWMHSKDAPHPDDIIVVIDPDNWLVSDVHPWTKDVSSKQAVGQKAYYGGDRTIQNLWKTFCQQNCDVPIVGVGVPYVVKASDLKDIAPLWRSYSIEILRKMDTVPTFKKRWEGLGVGWSAEMFGYNFACTHLGIKTKMVENLQVRDVESTRKHFDVPMIHMGRAWFPHNKPELAAPFRSADDGGFNQFGIQVWCKCNDTASKVRPWPIPDGLDFVSRHTLRLLHDAKDKYGPIPVNRNFRRDFYWEAP